jgi:hypothetical protein
LETSLINAFVGKGELESQLREEEIKCSEALSKLFEKTVQDKKKRRGSFDFVFEFELLGENFRWPDESEKTIGFAAGLFPKTNSRRTEPGSEFVLRQSGKLAEIMNAPFVENGENAGKLVGLFLGGLHEAKE